MGEKKAAPPRFAKEEAGELELFETEIKECERTALGRLQAVARVEVNVCKLDL